jgi:hypothetical protein
MLVYNIREDPKDLKATEWYKTSDKTLGRMTLAHAGYCGSNANMGVIEVDWREVKRIALSTGTIGQYTGTFVKAHRRF